MIVEYAQLLSSAHRVLNPNTPEDACYKLTHKNNRFAVWTRRSDQNYKWLYKLFIALQAEYTHRYGRIHSSSRFNEFLAKEPEGILWSFFTEPPLAMPDDCKVDSVSESYRNCYRKYKRHIAVWTKRDIPYWYE